MDPAEDQRKRDRDREQAAPEQQLVHPPPQIRDRLRMNVCPSMCVAKVVATSTERCAAAPRPASVRTCARRTAALAACSARSRSDTRSPSMANDHRERVNHQRRIEVLQVSRADDDRGNQQRRRHRRPGAGAELFRVRDVERAERRRVRSHAAAAGTRRAFSDPQRRRRSAPADRSLATRRPTRSRKNPSSSGGKNPPRPPIAPTSPVTVADARGEELRHQLEDGAVAGARAAPRIRALPTVNGIIDGHISSSANGTSPASTPDSTRAPPIRSESMPPTGRINVASTTKPAVRNPASVIVRPNSSRSSVGR